MPLRAGRLAGAGEDDVEVGDAAVGDPGLLAVEDVAVAVARGGHVHVGDVGARARLRQREGGDRLAGPRLRAASRCCSGVPNRLIAPVPSPCMAKAKSARPSWRASVSRVRQSVRTSSGAGSSGSTAVGCSQPSSPSVPTSVAAGGVDVVRDRRGEVLRAPAPRAARRSSRCAVSKNGQSRKAAVGHQSPSNTGFCLATKAW